MSSKIKNALELIHQPTGIMITFCYGAKAYRKYIKEQYNIEEIIPFSACSLELIHNETNQYGIVVGVKKHKDIYALKAIIVHELSHTVSQIMEYYNFDCDEFRSYTLQWLYQEIMPSLDARLQKDYDKKNK